MEVLNSFLDFILSMTDGNTSAAITALKALMWVAIAVIAFLSLHGVNIGFLFFPLSLYIVQYSKWYYERRTADGTDCVLLLVMTALSIIIFVCGGVKGRPTKKSGTTMVKIPITNLESNNRKVKRR